MKIAGKSMFAGLTLLATTTFAGGAVAGAQDNTDAYVGAEPEVLSEVLTPASPSRSAAAGSAAVEPQVQGSALAFTGGDALALSLVGGAAVAGGAGILVARRRSTT